MPSEIIYFLHENCDGKGVSIAKQTAELKDVPTEPALLLDKEKGQVPHWAKHWPKETKTQVTAAKKKAEKSVAGSEEVE